MLVLEISLLISLPLSVSPERHPHSSVGKVRTSVGLGGLLGRRSSGESGRDSGREIRFRF